MTPESSVRALSGIGPKRAQALARLGIFTVRDLLYHFPVSYQERGNVRLLCDAPQGENGAVILTVGTRAVTARLKGHMTVSHFNAYDDSGVCRLTFFNQSYLENRFPLGSTHRFWGKVEQKGGRFVMTSPDSEPVLSGRALPRFTARYPLTAGISHKQMAAYAAEALTAMRDYPFADILPVALREKYDLPALYDALCAVHCPPNEETAQRAGRRFLLEELYPFCLGLAMAQQKRDRGHAPQMSLSEADEKAFLDALPYSLTAGQTEAVHQIACDLGRDVPMRRMLCGDVGSGKTVCAAYAAYICLKNGYQCAFMAPTEILAQQHARSLGDLFAKLGYSTALLTGSLKASQANAVRRGTADGSVQLVIGTHALLSESTAFCNLGLVVTDEQHRFGVMQRTSLTRKTGASVHTLVMSATPIPRSLSLILYGDLDMSALRELPPGRQKIDTAVIDESYRAKLFGFMRRELAYGHQIYVVCPAVDDPEEDESGERTLFGAPTQKTHAVTSHAAYLQNEVFPDATVAILHGKLPTAEKEEVMRRFAAGQVQILVATTVVEVGVDVPNATLMVVEDADRFGLSQLHQLRGRVGRGSAKSYCVLVSSSPSDAAKERLETLHRTNDGFEIAQTDLRLRGPGDFFPSPQGEVHQHGNFRFAALCDDMELLRDVFAFAESVLQEDPTLSSEENRLAAQSARRMFYADGSVIN